MTAHVLTGLLSLLLPDETPSVAAVWYLESVVGDLSRAAALYEEMYVGRPPWRGVDAEFRERAALRAGLCLERTGKSAAALVPYEWLRQRDSGDPGATLYSLRSRIAADRARPGGDPVVVLERFELDDEAQSLPLVRVTLSDRITAMRELVQRASAGLRALDDSRNLEREEFEVASALRRDLLAEQIVVEVNRSPEAIADLHPVRRRLDAMVATLPDFESLASAVAEALTTRGLDALAAGDTDRAVRCFLGARSFGVEAALAVRFSTRLAAGEDPSSLAVTARRAGVDAHLRQVGMLRQEIRPLLERAWQNQERVVRPDYSLGRIAQIRTLLDWAPERVRRDPLVHELERRAETLYATVAFGLDDAPRLESHWGVRRLHVELGIKMLSDFAEATAGVWAAGRDLVVSTDAKRRMLRGRVDAAIARARTPAGSTRRAVTDAALARAAVILDWFPALDADGALAQAISSLRRARSPDLPEEP